ncbi:MAG TPA: GNAT family protein [Actinotalea caeni]|uniref:GNAT family N-acetyltransferase n=1 Tax=Actinotalea caeni TaxID=1348467 RepID=UPI0012E25D7A|nr:GNAT family protein [Actinotalea caeni]HLV56799.1 GNAT family protein [Actinotalea caeni]
MSDAAVDFVLREVEDADLHAFYSYLQDPRAQAMASSSVEDGSDPQAFDAYWARLRRSPTAVTRTIALADDPEHGVLGHIEKYEDEGRPYVRYWIDREYWGRGIGTNALRRFLSEVVTERPIFARQHRSNEASLVVLKRNGFKLVGQDTGYDAMRARMLDDIILRLG